MARLCESHQLRQRGRENANDSCVMSCVEWDALDQSRHSGPSKSVTGFRYTANSGIVAHDG